MNRKPARLSQEEKVALSNISIDFDNYTNDELAEFICNYSEIPFFARLIKAYGITKPSSISAYTLFDGVKNNDPTYFDDLLKLGESPNTLIKFDPIAEYLISQSKFDYVNKLLECQDLNLRFIEEDNMNSLTTLLQNNSELAYQVLSKYFEDDGNYNSFYPLLSYAKKNEDSRLATFLVSKGAEIDDDTIKWAYTRDIDDLMEIIFKEKQSVDNIIKIMIENRDFDGLISLGKHGFLASISETLKPIYFRTEVTPKYASFYEQLFKLGVEIDEMIAIHAYIVMFAIKGKSAAEEILPKNIIFRKIDITELSTEIQYTKGVVKAIRSLIDKGVHGAIQSTVSSALNLGLFEDAVYLLNKCTDLSDSAEEFKKSFTWKFVDALRHNNKNKARQVLKEMNKPVDHDLISVYTNAKQIVYETKNTDLEKDLPTECFGFDIPSLWSKECSEKTIALIVKEHNKVDTKLNVYREYRKKFPSMLKYIAEVFFKNSDTDGIKLLVKKGLPENDILRLYKEFPSFGPLLYFAKANKVKLLSEMDLGLLSERYPKRMLKAFADEFIPYVCTDEDYMRVNKKLLDYFVSDKLISNFQKNNNNKYDNQKKAPYTLAEVRKVFEFVKCGFGYYGCFLDPPSIDQTAELEELMNDPKFTPNSSALFHAVQYHNINLTKNILKRANIQKSDMTTAFIHAIKSDDIDIADLFISNVTVNDEKVMTNAIENGKPRFIEYLINNKFDIHKKTNVVEKINGKSTSESLNICWTAYAAFVGRLDIVYFVLGKYQLNPNEIDDTLFVACRNGYFGLVKTLISKHNADPYIFRTSVLGKCSAFWISLYYSHFNISEYLIIKGADVNDYFSGKEPQLIFKAIGCKRLDIVRFLIKHNCNYKVVNKNGYNIVHHALDSIGDNPGFMRGLFKSCDPKDIINQVTPNGYTPIVIAIKNRLIKSVGVLLQNGADPNIETILKPNNKKTSGFIAATESNKRDDFLRVFFENGYGVKKSIDLACKLRDVSLIENAIKTGADPKEVLEELCKSANDGDNTNFLTCIKFLADSIKGPTDIVDKKTGQSLIHLLAYTNEVASANVLISHCARINTLDKKNMLPLHIAIEQKKTRMAVHLIKAGSDYRIPFPSGVPVIIYATQTGQVEVVNELLKGYANVNERYKGYTPLLIAAASRNLNAAMIKTIMEYNPDLSVVTDGAFAVILSVIKNKYNFVINIINKMEMGKSMIKSETISMHVALSCIREENFFDIVNLVLDHGISFLGVKFDAGLCDYDSMAILLENGGIPVFREVGISYTKHRLICQVASDSRSFSSMMNNIVFRSIKMKALKFERVCEQFFQFSSPKL